MKMTKLQMVHYLNRFNIDTIENLNKWSVQRLRDSVKFIKDRLDSLK